MRFLLDTHALIWFLSADKQLSSTAKQQINNSTQTGCLVSIATFWEISIKINLGKIKFKHSFAELKTKVSENNFEILPIIFAHTLTVSSLPLYHRDPFDRILIHRQWKKILLLFRVIKILDCIRT